MAKAKITTADGMTIAIDGAPKEIAALVKDLRAKSAETELTRRRVRAKSAPVLLGDLIASLRDGGFFKQLRDLASVKARLAEMGHHYPVTTLSPIMLRQVRRRNLRRIREKGRWMYTR